MSQKERKDARRSGAPDTTAAPRPSVTGAVDVDTLGKGDAAADSDGAGQPESDWLGACPGCGREIDVREPCPHCQGAPQPPEDEPEDDGETIGTRRGPSCDECTIEDPRARNYPHYLRDRLPFERYLPRGMVFQTSKVDRANGVRTKYYKCDACGATKKETEEI